LEEILNGSWRIPFSAYLVVNQDSLHGLIDQMRTAIPKQIRQAEKISQDRDRLLAQAEEEANRVLQRAHDDSIRLADEHELVRAAALRAQTVTERAHREADTLRSEADEYVRGVLIALAEHLGGMEAQVTKAQAKVQDYLQTVSQPRDSAAR
jgi:cell division septum initiation protein DivIVA